MSGLLPVHQIGRGENRIIGGPFRGGASDIVSLVDPDNGRIGYVTVDHGIGKIGFLLR